MRQLRDHIGKVYHCLSFLKARICSYTNIHKVTEKFRQQTLISSSPPQLF